MGGNPSRVRVTGPLTPYASGFASALLKAGYTLNATADQLRLLAHLSRWLASKALGAADLTYAVGNAFLITRRASGYTLWLSPKALAPLLQYLRSLGAAPPEPVVEPTPVDAMLARYREHLTSERGLTVITSKGYEWAVRRFLSEREEPDGSLALEDLCQSDIAAFIVAELPKHQTGSVKLIVTALRSFLEFLCVTGGTTRSLASSVPSVRDSRLAGLPKALPPGHAQRLLASCDRRTAVGRRDFAVLSMLARLGLRAGEIGALELRDVDWRAGEFVVRGKGDRRERLPLPVDVGCAVANYLRGARPVCDCERLFLSVRAPHRALTAAAVFGIVAGAARKAGLPPAGPHRLRHTAATEILRAGAPLSEIGQLLRHRSPMSTAIYAKVDRDALRRLARPWPAGGAA